MALRLTRYSFDVELDEMTRRFVVVSRPGLSHWMVAVCVSFNLRDDSECR